MYGVWALVWTVGGNTVLEELTEQRFLSLSAACAWVALNCSEQTAETDIVIGQIEAEDV